MLKNEENNGTGEMGLVTPIPGCSVVAQFCFCVTAAAWSVGIPWTTKTAVVAQQVIQRRQNHCHGGSRVAVVAEWGHSGHHSDRSMDTIGRPKKAQ